MKYNTIFGENQAWQIQSAMIYCTSSGTTLSPSKKLQIKVKNTTWYDKHFKIARWKKDNKITTHTKMQLNIGTICHNLNIVLSLSLKEKNNQKTKDE